MQTLDHDYTIHHQRGAGDDSLLVKFFMDTVQDHVETKKQGRPVFRDCEMIDIRIPGSKDSVVIRPARDKDKDRFPRHYQAFKNRVGNQEQVVGTPLEQWPLLTKSQVEELKFFNVRTVEQLAGAPDSTGQKFMGFNGLKQKAKDYLAAAEGNAPILALREENESLKLSLQQMQDEMKDMRKQLKRALKDKE